MSDPAGDGAATGLEYASGFGNEFATEALKGALPRGRNSPQRPPFGLYAEQFSTTSFTMPRADARRSWFYRIRPSAAHREFRRLEHGGLHGPLSPPTPNRLRWNPVPLPIAPTDFLDGLVTIAANAPPEATAGIAIHLYCANRSMERVFYNADGELLLVPETGALRFATECGLLSVQPGEILVIPRGIKFRAELLGPVARGYICENHGAPFRLPDLGPIGANGLANARDFLTPTAWFEDRDEPVSLVQKFAGRLWETQLDHSPLDVVAWHGNSAPYKYDLSRFNTLGTVSFDHPDPSIFTVLTSPTATPGIANCDFVIFPPRWMVGENTFRPPWFHRNVMSEYMGLVSGEYDAKSGGFEPGGGSLHNRMSAHGPDAATTRQAMTAELKPHKIDHTLAFMFETSEVIRPAMAAMQPPLLQHDYDACWAGLTREFKAK